ncbi:MAG: EamA family transporter [Alphaproteobacteria bacterium PA4]|nr:MAG: EamA family transporter [Alphaproteobacteria bacterium PA4]
MTGRNALLASAAVAAFAGNSLIARAALGQGLIDPGAFSAIRPLAGALVLLPLLGRWPRVSNLTGGLALLIYMVGFSIACRDIPTATGALILFASVQMTVVLGGIAQGQTLSARAANGLLVAIAGILWLLLPAGGAPAPLALPAMALGSGLTSLTGAVLAVLAGVVTSALVYVLWYKVAPRLGLASLTAVQLATPIVAGSAAALLLAEPIAARLAVAGVIVLGGVALTLKR